ncbi:ABC transporter ATP-binding protein, partial [Lactobacillus nasalidis]|uniref:ABC transporter ATP-binding protein n=3 Tax=Lactobacillus nasalidis TaxID=2797258 RepID=UPI001915B698
TVTADLVDKGVIGKNLPYIWQTGGRMLLVAGIGLLAALGNIYFAAHQAMQVGQRLRAMLFAKVLSFSDEEISRFGQSSLITRTTNDVVQVQMTFMQLLRMLMQSPIMLVAGCILAYLQQPRLATVFAISLPLLAAIIGLLMYLAMPLFKSIQQKTDRINLIFREGLTGVRVIRAFRQDQREQDRFAAANRDYTKTGIKAYTIISFMLPAVTLVLSLTNVGIVFLGSRLIAGRIMEVGRLLTFLTYATQILMSFMMLSMLFIVIPRASVSARRINEVLDAENQLRDPVQPVKAPQGPASLEFDQVSFRYAGAEDPALSGISFKAAAGQTLALIGGTGSGKSTLVNLIPRLLDVEQGEVKVNGVAVTDLRQNDLHGLISLTQQKAVLFKGTVRSNLLFGKATASEKEMWHALEIAQAAGFVKENGGLDAVVEAGGANFSGGQRQRLAIARTIIKDAAIYIFDDSFSALDFKTDAALRQALAADEKMRQAITVIVAQRVSTVANADQILVLDGGRVVGQGKHEELKRTCPNYQQIVASQFQKGGREDAPRS